MSSSFENDWPKVTKWPLLSGPFSTIGGHFGVVHFWPTGHQIKKVIYQNLFDRIGPSGHF